MIAEANGATIHALLAAAQKSMPHVAKGGNNTYDDYRYATLEDFINACGSALAEQGLALVSSVDEIIPMDDRTTKNGGKEHCVRVKMSFKLCGPGGEIIEATCFGEGQDRADKALYKAITGCRKYGLASLLNLATKDDPEADETVGRSKPARQRNQDGEAPPTKPRQQATKPPCPKCGKSEFVFQQERDDPSKGFFCWKNSEKKKLGCGHKWSTADAQATNGAPAEPNGETEKQSNPKVLQDIVGLIAKATDLDKIAKLADYIDKKRSEGFLMPKDADMLTAQVEAKDKLIRTQEPVGA